MKIKAQLCTHLANMRSRSSPPSHNLPQVDINISSISKINKKEENARVASKMQGICHTNNLKNIPFKNKKIIKSLSIEIK
jgi:hypothetical protein